MKELVYYYKLKGKEEMILPHNIRVWVKRQNDKLYLFAQISTGDYLLITAIEKLEYFHEGVLGVMQG